MFDGHVWRGRGCEKCNRSGFRGRVGYFELLPISAAVRKAIAENQSTSTLIEVAGDSYERMRTDGLRKAARGLSTIEEVLRATQDADDTGV